MDKGRVALQRRVPRVRSGRNIECDQEHVYETPDGQYDRKTDEAPEDELPSGFSFRVTVGTKDEVFVDPVDEIEERDSKKERDEDRIDKADDAVRIRLNGANVDACS